jgi:phosphotransacetylase
MAQADHAYITSRFHNLSNAALADALGHADAVLKGAEAESKSSARAPCQTSTSRTSSTALATSIASLSDGGASGGVS